MSQAHNTFIHCMLIPLQQHYLLLPNSTIAEIVPKTGVSNSANLPEYWLGELQWREQALPIIDLENMIKPGSTVSQTDTKFCILNSLGAHNHHAFYAIPCAGSPQLITLNQSALKPANDDNASAFLHCQIQIGNKLAFIPNLDQLEMAIESHKQ